MKDHGEVATCHKAYGKRLHPYERGWCRACVGGTGRSDARQRLREEQNSLLVAGTAYGFVTDGDDGEHTQGGTFFSGGESPAEHDDLVWHACPVQRCGGSGQLVRLGSPELTASSDKEPTVLVAVRGAEANALTLRRVAWWRHWRCCEHW